jgi:hypothetical protein
MVRRPSHWLDEILDRATAVSSAGSDFGNRHQQLRADGQGTVSDRYGRVRKPERAPVELDHSGSATRRIPGKPGQQKLRMMGGIGGRANTNLSAGSEIISETSGVGRRAEDGPAPSSAGLPSQAINPRPIRTSALILATGKSRSACLSPERKWEDLGSVAMLWPRFADFTYPTAELNTPAVAVGACDLATMHPKLVLLIGVISWALAIRLIVTILDHIIR